MADEEIASLLCDGAPCRDVLLADPDIGPVLRRASTRTGGGGGEAVVAATAVVEEEDGPEDGDDILDAALEASEVFTPGAAGGGTNGR